MELLKQRWIAAVVAVAALAVRAAAQPVVVTGTGDPNVDVPDVQAAVDKGGHVLLTGRFSFDRPPTTPDWTIYSRMVRGYPYRFGNSERARSVYFGKS